MLALKKLLGRVLGFACGGRRDCFGFPSVATEFTTPTRNTYKQHCLASEDPASMHHTVLVSVCFALGGIVIISNLSKQISDVR